MELNLPIIEEERRREEATMEELKSKLTELGVAFDCDYDTCYIIYKGYKWDIEKQLNREWLVEWYRRREEALNELRELFEKYGIRIYGCDDTCEIRYKGFEFGIWEVI